MDIISMKIEKSINSVKNGRGGVERKIENLKISYTKSTKRIIKIHIEKYKKYIFFIDIFRLSVISSSKLIRWLSSSRKNWGAGLSILTQMCLQNPSCFLRKRIAKDMPIRRRRESIERTGFRIAEKGEIACARKAGDGRSHKKEERRLRAPRIFVNCYCVCFFVI